MYTVLNNALNTIVFNRIKPRTKRYKEEYDEVCNNRFAFDIETSSGFYKDGDIIPFDKSKPPNCWESYDKVGIMYFWQFAIDDNVFYGRTVDDLISFLDDLEENCPQLKFIYVHNLGFEFNAVIRENFIVKSLFARKERHPITVTLEDYNIEFRCSYQLTGLALANCVKEFKLNTKKLDTLDYSVIRTPLTKITNDELSYCINDVLIITEMLAKYEKEYKGIYNIPLTQTGEVRREVKRLFNKNLSWLKLCKSLNNYTFNDYNIMCQLLSGGYTHANRLFVNYVINEKIKCMDFASSYPWVLLSCKYPLSKFVKTDYDEKYNDKDKYAWIAKIKFVNLHCVKCNEYLSIHKAISKTNILSDNGKLVKADECIYYLTSIDYEIVRNNYEWDLSESEFLDFRYSLVDYLPNEFRKLVLDYYNKKTQFKNVKGMEDIYLKAKQKLNSMYGMMLTKIYNEKISFIDNDWKSQKLSEQLYYEIKSENDKKALQNNFLPFQCGIFVTCHARYNLFQILTTCDTDICYCDTDSVYYFDEDVNEVIKDYNCNVLKKHEEIAKQLNIDISQLSPKDPEGITHPIGIMDLDGEYSEGVFLGAKRYALRELKTNKLKQTVAGVRKGSVDILEDDLHNFTKGLIYSYDFARKNIMTYNENQQKGLVWNKGMYDEYVSRETFSNNLMPTTFSLKIDDDYLRFVEYCQKGEFKNDKIL